MSERMDYEEDALDDVTLVKYSNPVLVIKNPDKPVSGGSAKVKSLFSINNELYVSMAILIIFTFHFTTDYYHLFIL